MLSAHLARRAFRASAIRFPTAPAVAGAPSAAPKTAVPQQHAWWTVEAAAAQTAPASALGARWPGNEEDTNWALVAMDVVPPSEAYYNVPHWAADEGEIARPATAAQAVSSDKTVVFTDLKLFKALARRVRRHFSAAGGAPLFLRDAVVNSNVHATVPVRVLGNVVEADETLDELMEQAGGRFGSTPNDFAYEASVLVASGFQTPPAKFGLDGADTWIAYAPEAHAAVVASASGRPDAAAVRRAVELVGAHKLAEAPRNAVYLPGVDAFDLEGKDGSVLVVGDKEAATAGIAGLAPFATDGVVLASGGVSRFWANPEAKANVVQPPKAVLFLGAAKDGSVAAKDVTARLVAAAGLDPKKATSFAKAVDAVVGEIGAKAVDVKKGGDVKKALAGLL